MIRKKIRLALTGFSLNTCPRFLLPPLSSLVVPHGSALPNYNGHWLDGSQTITIVKFYTWMKRMFSLQYQLPKRTAVRHYRSIFPTGSMRIRRDKACLVRCDLFHQHHFLRRNKITRLKAVQINPRRQSRTVEGNRMASRWLHFIHERNDFPAKQVKDFQ